MKIIAEPVENINVNNDVGLQEEESLQQPLWHVAVLTIFTCSAYVFYWFYKNWRDLSKQAELTSGAADELLAINQFANQSCLLRTIGLFVPILNIYFAASQIKGIAQLNPESNCLPAKHPLLSAGLIVTAILGCELLSQLPGALYLLSFSVFVPLVIAQSWLNSYWQSVESANLIVRQAFTVKELAAIIVGGLLLGLIVAGILILPADFARAH